MKKKKKRFSVHLFVLLYWQCPQPGFHATFQWLSLKLCYISCIIAFAVIITLFSTVVFVWHSLLIKEICKKKTVKELFPGINKCYCNSCNLGNMTLFISILDNTMINGTEVTSLTILCCKSWSSSTRNLNYLRIKDWLCQSKSTVNEHRTLNS